MRPYWGPNLQPTHVPWLGTELEAFCFAEWCPANWATLVWVVNKQFGRRREALSFGSAVCLVMSHWSFQQHQEGGCFLLIGPSNLLNPTERTRVGTPGLFGSKASAFSIMCIRSNEHRWALELIAILLMLCWDDLRSKSSYYLLKEPENCEDTGVMRKRREEKNGESSQVGSNTVGSGT